MDSDSTKFRSDVCEDFFWHLYIIADILVIGSLSSPFPLKKWKMKRERDKKKRKREQEGMIHSVWEDYYNFIMYRRSHRICKKKVSPSKIGVWGNISNRGRRVIFKGIEEYLLLDGGHWTRRDAGSEYLHKGLTAAACFVEPEPVRILLLIAESSGMMRNIGKFHCEKYK